MFAVEVIKDIPAFGEQAKQLYYSSLNTFVIFIIMVPVAVVVRRVDLNCCIVD
jgi:hypothetical protein